LLRKLRYQQLCFSVALAFCDKKMSKKYSVLKGFRNFVAENAEYFT